MPFSCWNGMVSIVHRSITVANFGYATTTNGTGTVSINIVPIISSP